jgi:hypothetical protein
MSVRPPLIEQHDGRDAFVDDPDELGHGEAARHINIHARGLEARRCSGQFQPGRLELLAVAAHAAEELDEKTTLRRLDEAPELIDAADFPPLDGFRRGARGEQESEGAAHTHSNGVIVRAAQDRRLQQFRGLQQRCAARNSNALARQNRWIFARVR